MSPLFPNIQSDLDLNGPTLSFSTQPVGTSCSVASGIATFIGIATATFPETQTERETNTGTVTHQWHSGTTALTDGTVSGVTITGSATTTLTLSGLTSPLSISDQVFVQAGYDPNNLTPNAINEPLNSDSATLTVFPTISIDTQPQNTTAVEDIETTVSIVASASDGSDSDLSYQWYLNDSPISGANSATLSITRPDPGLDRVYCEVSHSTAQPSIVTSTEVNLDVASARTFIIWEKIGNGARQEQGQRNLATSGPFTARARPGIGSRMVQIFSPEKDVDVKITMGGAAGSDRNGRRGGEGGISVFKMTLKQNIEYTVKLGIDYFQGGGPRGGINGGGGLAAIYEKAKVLAVCGGGGSAGSNGRGGDGGGCNVAGERGQSQNGSNGGSHVAVDTLPPTGMSQAGRTGFRDFDLESSGSGRLSGCTIGNYWNQQGKSPCEDVGTGVAFLDNNGGILSDTTSTSTGSIIRGYKSGQGHRNNAGAGSGNGGGGGGGARGGEGNDSTGGGGGGSGYYSSQVELLSSSTLPNGTQLGGNADVAFISVEVYDQSLDGNQEPLIPPASGAPLEAERTVTFSVSREAGDNNTVTFSRQSGSGPSAITFGPNGGNITTQISSGAVYTRTGSSASGGRGLSFRLSGNTLQLDDNLDNDFNDLQVTPNEGTFTSDSRYEANW